MKIYQKIGYGIMHLVFWLETLVLLKLMGKSGNGLYALGIIISLIIYFYINIKIYNLDGKETDVMVSTKEIKQRIKEK